LPHRILTLIFFCLFLSGCAVSRLASFPAVDGLKSVELEDTAFFPQKTSQCGPAALATLFRSSGSTVGPDELAPYLYLPGRRGSLQVEVISASRRFGRIPYVIDPEPSALQAELLAGRPVLVLQNLGLRLIPVFHYAVVIGILDDDQVVLRSGEERRLVMAGGRFAATWRRADSWGMVLLRPGELPANTAVPERYLLEVAAIESMGRLDSARAAYEAALARWPDQPDALFGLANTLLAQGQSNEAAGIYRKLIEIQPRHTAAINNLAEALSRQGCFTEALILIDETLKATGEADAFAPALRQTRLEIKGRKPAGRQLCHPALPPSSR